MNRKLFTGVLAILALFTGATFINFVSAEKAERQAAPQISTTIVISQVYGGGGATAGTPTYKYDYVELLNISTSPQSLDGLSIMYGSQTGNFGSSAGNIAALPTGVTLQPGRRYLVQLGAAGTVGAELPVTPDFVSSNITASATNGKIALTNGLAPNSCGATATPCSLPNPQIIDLVAYGAANNAEGNAPVAVLSNTTGAVRNADGCQDTDNNAADFTVVTNPVPRNTAAPATTCGGGTPTPTITVSPTPTITPTVTPTPFGTAVAGIKINEVYGGGGNTGALYNQDFVELYNSGANSVDINGYSLQYSSAAGTSNYAVCTITAADTIIEPNTYFLIATGPISTTVGIALPTVNASCPTSINLSGTAGKLALVSNTTAANAATCPPSSSVVDFVGYGTTATCAEGTNAPQPADSQSSISRTSAGADTNNNSADFASGVPSPTAGAVTVTRDANVDFNGDGVSDYVVTRNDSGAKTWYVSINGTGAFSGVGFGAAGDIEVPEDYDGDGKDDIAVWREGSISAFYILQSSNNTVRSAAFGTTGDDPRVVADYDGDNKADIGVYRKSASQNYYYYISSVSGNLVTMPWGGGTTARPNVGDYDGDNKADFCIQYDGGSGNGVFALQKSSGGNEFVAFGLTSDKLAPGDYDGDGKTDFTVVRVQNGALAWYTLNRSNQVSGVSFGAPTDILTPGDYDGDGKQDVGVWRQGSPSAFYSLRSSNNTLQAFGFGIATDTPAATWYTH